MDDKEILKEVVFAILMENHDGILGKAPSYLEEKRKVIDRCKDVDQAARFLLDSDNMDIYHAYKKLWMRSLENGK
jgi:hypothetical protein